MKGVLLPARVSLCMVVWEDDARLRSGLEAVKNLVDEIILVDGGLSEPARQITAKLADTVIGQVWDGNFSTARNLALQHATGDWILQLDPEDLLEIDPAQFKQLDATNLGYQILEYVELPGGGYQKRERLLLFKNVAGIEYSGLFQGSPLASLRQLAMSKGIASAIEQADGIRVIHQAPGNLTLHLERQAEVLVNLLEQEPENPNYLYQYCLVSRGLSQAEKTIKFFNRIPHHPEWFQEQANPVLVGIMGFLGIAVLLNQVPLELVTLFKTRGSELGKQIGWSDLRLSVPYALWVKREGRAQESAHILLQCIRAGGAGADTPVSLNERTAPVVLLLSLYHELGLDDELYSFVGELPDHLVNSGLDIESVFEVVYAQDSDLFEYIFELLKSRGQAG